jgi:hypothetical protein
MNKPRLQSAKNAIFLYFDHQTQHALNRSEISSILNSQRDVWNLGSNINVAKFTQFLIDQGRLRKFEFAFPKPYKKETRYTWGNATLHEVCLSLKLKGYFSHYTALSLHNLTEQLPKTLYLNVEQANSSISSGTLTQASIDSAMRRAPRMTKQIAQVGDYRVAILQGKNTGDLGVITKNLTLDPKSGPAKLRFTDLERTIIDITVRPQYAGGVAEVLKAYSLARPRLSVARLTNLLRQLDFTYPYHQAIGFYLTRAGYAHKAVSPLREFPMKFDFQLAHGIKSTDYVAEWRLRVPQGL